MNFKVFYFVQTHNEICRNEAAHKNNNSLSLYFKLNVHFYRGMNQHRLTFLVGQDGKIKHLFGKFKTKDHHQVVLDYLAAE